MVAQPSDAEFYHWFLDSSRSHGFLNDGRRHDVEDRVTGNCQCNYKSKVDRHTQTIRGAEGDDAGCDPAGICGDQESDRYTGQ